MGCFAWVLYDLSTTNEQIELGYLLNGSNNGHDPYLARGPWEKASPWITEKGPTHAMSTRQAGTSDSKPPSSPGFFRRTKIRRPPPSILAGDEQIGVGVHPSSLGLGPGGSTAPSLPTKKLPRHHREGLFTSPTAAALPTLPTACVRPLPPPDPSSVVPPCFIQVSRPISLCSHEFRVDSAPILAGIPRLLRKFDTFW
jgi:hypothetical protein